MRTRLEWNWEQLDEGTFRAAVFGGWLILHIKTVMIVGKNTAQIQSESMSFVPDREHSWSILKPVVESEKKPSIANDF